MNPRLAPTKGERDSGLLTAPEPEPEPAEDPDPAPVEEPAQSATYEVTFRSADPSISALVVKCHRGSAAGTNPVTVKAAEDGPCRVQGRTDGGGVVAFVTLDGPKTFDCFEGGSRECR